MIGAGAHDAIAMLNRRAAPIKDDVWRSGSEATFKTYSDDDIKYNKYAKRNRLGTATIASCLLAVTATYLICFHLVSYPQKLFVNYVDNVMTIIDSIARNENDHITSPHILIRDSEYKLMSSLCNTKSKRYMKLDHSSQAYFKFDTNESVPSLASASHYANNNILWNKLGRRFDQRILECDLVTGRATKTRLLHVINPFRSDNRRRIFIQNITMASIEVARAWIKHISNGKIAVDVVTIEIDNKIDKPFDPPLRPLSFYRSPVSLSRTSEELIEKMYNNTATSTSFYESISNKIIKRNMRKLPLVKDVLKIAHDISSACAYDRIIYSNADIGVMPHFYSVVSEMMKCKSTFFINRVEIPDVFTPSTVMKDSRGISFLRRTEISNTEGRTDPKLNLEAAYTYTLEYEQSHPGYDCFVARPETISEIVDVIGDIFVGFPPVGSALAKAAKRIDPGCVAARNFPATFHIGSKNGDWGLNTKKDEGGGKDYNNESNNNNNENFDFDNKMYHDLNGYLHRKSKLYMNPSKKTTNTRGRRGISGSANTILETCGAVTMYNYVIKNRETVCYPNDFYPIDLSRSRKVRRLEN